jgi:hypothetical protein
MVHKILIFFKIFTPEQKIFMIESYFRNDHHNKKGALQEFIEKFANVAVPLKKFSIPVEWKMNYNNLFITVD